MQKIESIIFLICFGLCISLGFQVVNACSTVKPNLERILSK